MTVSTPASQPPKRPLPPTPTSAPQNPVSAVSVPPIAPPIEKFTLPARNQRVEASRLSPSIVERARKEIADINPTRFLTKKGAEKAVNVVQRMHGPATAEKSAAQELLNAIKEENAPKLTQSYTMSRVGLKNRGQRPPKKQHLSPESPGTVPAAQNPVSNAPSTLSAATTASSTEQSSGLIEHNLLPSQAAAFKENLSIRISPPPKAPSPTATKALSPPPSPPQKSSFLGRLFGNGKKQELSPPSSPPSRSKQEQAIQQELEKKLSAVSKTQ